MNHYLAEIEYHYTNDYIHKNGLSEIFTPLIPMNSLRLVLAEDIDKAREYVTNYFEKDGKYICTRVRIQETISKPIIN